MKPRDIVSALIIIAVIALGGYYLIRHPEVALYDAQQNEEGRGR